MAPMTFFGILSKRGNGHAAAAILVAMLAMMLTAISYGRMARAYPSAGSAYTYVGSEISPSVGFVVGWSMVLDYIVNPMLNVIFCSQQLHVIFPACAYWAWAIVFAALFTILNVQGIKTSARLNALLAAGMGVVVLVFFVAAAAYVAHHPHPASAFTHPLYDAPRWTLNGLLSGTALAVLAYMGFDSISTLSEEAKNPRDVLPATVLTCVVIGLLSAFEVYAAQLVWPVTEAFPDIDTAFTSVAGRTWAPLYVVLGGALVVSCIASGTGMQLGAARLLYGMGRGGALPRSFFGVLEPVKRIPRNSVIFVGAAALLGAIVLPMIAGESTGFDLAASLLNFGALIGFMGVNTSALLRFYWRATRRRLINLLLPAAGFIVCLVLWWNLSTQARILGAVWMIAGIAVGAWRTRGFRAGAITFEVPPEVVADPNASGSGGKLPPGTALSAGIP